MTVISKPEIKPIPLWKWILLYFCPAHVSYSGTEGAIACVCISKVLFKHIYLVRTDYYSMTTGNLLRTSRLTRKGV